MARNDSPLPFEPVPGLDPGNSDTDPEFPAASPTAHLLDELALYGYRPGQDEPDPRPLPEPDAVQAQLDRIVEAFGAMLTGTRLEDDLDDLLCCLGLMMPLARKSVEPLAAMTAPATVAAKHQCLLHFVGNAPWSDAALLTKVGELVLPAIERGGPIEAWIVDDTGFPKKGRHSVGVTRQYCGQLGKQDNCQVAVSLSLANHEASLPVAYRLYLPEDWATDQARRDKAKVPETIAFHTKPEIALEQIKAARTAGLPQGVVLMDAGYGNDTHLRTEISALGMSYVAAIGPNTSVWPAGAGPLPPQTRSGRGRPRTRLQRDGQHQPITVKALALSLPAAAWQTIAWREGSADWLASRFARRRVRPAHRDNLLSAPRPEEWLLIEWPPDETEPTKYWFSTLSEDVAFDRLVDLTKLRGGSSAIIRSSNRSLALVIMRGAGGAASTTTPPSALPLTAS